MHLYFIWKCYLPSYRFCPKLCFSLCGQILAGIIWFNGPSWVTLFYSLFSGLLHFNCSFSKISERGKEVVEQMVVAILWRSKLQFVKHIWAIFFANNAYCFLNKLQRKKELKIKVKPLFESFSKGFGFFNCLSGEDKHRNMRDIIYLILSTRKWCPIL